MLDADARAAFWNQRILSWERARYSALARLNPCAWTVRSRLSAAAGLLNGELKECRDVLDLGCGSGLLAGELAESPARRYLGVDFSGAAIEAARLRFSAQADRVRFERGDAPTFKGPGAGVCVFLGLLDWLTEEEARELFNARREPRLLFSFTEPGGHFASLYARYRRRADAAEYRPRAYAEPEIRSLLSRAGYRADKVLRGLRLGPSGLLVAVRA